MEVGKTYERDDLLRQLHSPRHKNIVWCRSDKMFKVNVDGVARRLPGIHSVMDAFCKTVDGSRLSAYRRSETAPMHFDAYCDYARTADERGKDGGTIVHDQMQIYVMHGVTELRRRFATPHRLSLRLISFIEDNAIMPLLAELPVYDELHLGFATRADMIVFNPNHNRFEIWELKTGYNKTFTVADGRMYGPLRPYFDNSNLSRAMLQAMFTKMALKFRYGLDLVARVVLVNDDGVRTKVLPKDVVGRLEGLYTLCSKHLRDVRRKQEEATKKGVVKIVVSANAMAQRPLHSGIGKSMKEKLAVQDRVHQPRKKVTGPDPRVYFKQKVNLF